MKSFFTFFLVFFISFLQAQRAGTVDKSYGANHTGTVTITDKSAATSFAIQKDNKLLIGGIDSLFFYFDNHFMLTRRNNDGTLDSNFGTNGHVETAVDDLQKSVHNSNGWLSIAETADGKIVAVGTILWTNPNYPYDNQGDIDIVVARFMDGTPDESFGNKGRVVTNLDYLEYIRSVAVQPDGKIVVAGSSIQDIYGNTNGILVVRYNNDGTLDKSFGKYHGYTIYDEVRGTYGSCIVLQPDGKIVVGGTHIGNNSLFTVRYLENGRLDSAFGKYGVAESTNNTIRGNTQSKGIVLDANNRILVMSLISYQDGGVVARYLPNGQPDSSFDEDGQLEMYSKNNVHFITNTILMQSDNKIAISGCLLDKKSGLYRLAIVGLNEDGSFNTSFGNHDGKTLTSVYVYPEDFPSAAMQSDGKIIVINNKPYLPPYDTFATEFFTRFNGYKTLVPNNNIAARNTETVPTIITKQATIKISPNPAKDHIIINGLSVNNTTNITLNTSDGTVIKRLTTKNAAQYRLSLAGIATGIYFINIQDANGTVKMKMVKE